MPEITKLDPRCVSLGFAILMISDKFSLKPMPTFWKGCKHDKRDYIYNHGRAVRSMDIYIYWRIVDAVVSKCHFNYSDVAFLLFQANPLESSQYQETTWRTIAIQVASNSPFEMSTTCTVLFIVLHRKNCGNVDLKESATVKNQCTMILVGCFCLFPNGRKHTSSSWRLRWIIFLVDILVTGLGWQKILHVIICRRVSATSPESTW